MIDEKILVERLEEKIDKLHEHIDKGMNYPYALGSNNAYEDAIEIVNQLAKESKDDFCEWKGEDMLGLYNSSCRQKSIVNPFWTHCPYCGKKIKVVE